MMHKKKQMNERELNDENQREWASKAPIAYQTNRLLDEHIYLFNGKI
jgi:hypothetical protein